MEKVTIHVEVDGVELSPVEMGKGEQDHIYKDSIRFFSMGHLFNKEHTIAPYNYMFRLDRNKTTEEMRGDERSAGK